MHLFYTPDIDPLQSTYSLNEEESGHCVRVLRLDAGHEVNLIDGKGGYYTAAISLAHPKKTQLSITGYIPDYGRRSHHLHIAIAPTKSIDRFEWFLEKATEIGIDEITPITCERSERKEIKMDRIQKVVISAMKQSLKAYIPKLNPMIKLASFLEQPNIGDKFIAHCLEGDKPFLSQVVSAVRSNTILIGPEGDFSPPEIMIAQGKGFQPISLGEARLRTETAALAACLELNILNR